MKKMFILQKISMIAYCIAVFATFIYSLYFMTDYYKLGLYEHPKNQIIIDFYNSLQGFNFFIFFVSLFGAISVLALFVFQVGKKVVDKLALIIVSVGTGVMTIGSAIATGLLPGLLTRYLDDDLLKNEHFDWLPEGGEHVVKPLTLYFGYFILIFMLIVAVTLLVSVILTHVKYKKNLKDSANNSAEVGV